MRSSVLTVSDGVSHGVREDKSGEVLAERLAAGGFEVVERRVVPDEREEISAALRELAATDNLVVTTGAGDDL